MLFVAMFVAASDVTGFMFFSASWRKFFGSGSLAFAGGFVGTTELRGSGLFEK